MSKSKEQLADEFITENEIATQEEIDLVISICGNDYPVFNKIIYARLGFHSVKQLYGCCKDEFYFNDEVLENIDDLD